MAIHIGCGRGSAIVVHTTAEIDTAYHWRKHYHEFAPDMWIRNGTTVGEVFRAAGMDSGFDPAMPVSWVRENYWDKGLDTPLGMWDCNHGAFGHFVPISVAYKKLEELVKETRERERETV